MPAAALASAPPMVPKTEIPASVSFTTTVPLMVDARSPAYSGYAESVATALCARGVDDAQVEVGRLVDMASANASSPLVMFGDMWCQGK